MLSAGLDVKTGPQKGEQIGQTSTMCLGELEQDGRVETSCDPDAFICSSSERVNTLVKMIFSMSLSWG